MRVILWCCRAIIFLFLLAFALKNTEPVNLYFFFDASWRAPMSIVALVFFAIGAALGVLALCGAVFGLRREVARLKRARKANDGKDGVAEPARTEET
jgi:uncharacterized integral membrane protein